MIPLGNLLKICKIKKIKKIIIIITHNKKTERLIYRTSSRIFFCLAQIKLRAFSALFQLVIVMATHWQLIDINIQKRPSVGSVFFGNLK